MRISGRAVSEIAAAVMLAGVVLAMGGLIYLAYSGQLSSSRMLVESRVASAELLSSEALPSVARAVVRPELRSIELLVAVGRGHLAIASVYVDGTMVYGPQAGFALVNGAPSSYPAELPQLSLVNFTVIAPPEVLAGLKPGDAVEVLIVTRAGHKAAVLAEVLPR
ncbi:MAG: hypothetical protein QW405_01030 [Fervidicoccaceae archaeon]